MNPKRKARLQADDPGAGGGGAAAPAPAAPAPAPAAGTPPAAPAPPASAPSPAGDPTGSALSGGAPAPAPAEWTPESIPEKYRVAGQDGQLDSAATLRKVSEAHAALEKRMGSGDVRPKTADDYKLEGEQFTALGLDATSTADFRKEAHDLGLSQKQFDGVMARYAKIAPELAGSAKELDSQQTIAALKGVWTDPAVFTANTTAAYKVANSLAQKAGMTYDEVDKAIGNNPAAIRLLASLGDELGEDVTPVSAAGGAPGPVIDGVSTYLGQPGNWKAYSDQHDIRHAEVSAEVRRLSEKASKRL